MIEPAYRYRAKLIRAIDGDTYILAVDLGFRARLEMNVRVRWIADVYVDGVSIAELLIAAGHAARRSSPVGRGRI